MLRSCYTTEAVVEAGKPPVVIQWWFTDKPAWPKRHQWGSLNWQRPHVPPGDLGERETADRPWRDGSRPKGACGMDEPVQVSCNDKPLSSTGEATVTLQGAPSATFDIPWVASADSWWNLDDVRIPGYRNVSIRYWCAAGGIEPPRVGATLTAVHVASGVGVTWGTAYVDGNNSFGLAGDFAFGASQPPGHPAASASCSVPLYT